MDLDKITEKEYEWAFYGKGKGLKLLFDLKAQIESLTQELKIAKDALIVTDRYINYEDVIYEGVDNIFVDEDTKQQIQNRLELLQNGSKFDKDIYPTIIEN